jgi:heat shock protein HslJ
VAATLDGTGWVLEPACLPVPVPGGVEVTLAFLEGRLAGSAGCNRYSGSCLPSADGDLDVGAVVRTMMACLPAIMAVEDAYLLALDRVTGYRLDVGRLELLDASGTVVLRFVAGPPPEPA